MKIQDFNERLKDSILIADGAMGSLLHEIVGAVRCFDELNTSEPEAVFRVHQSYIEAGAQIIETNTFGANRFKLAPLGLGDDVQRLNSRGVKIAREAREAAAREVLIAGSIGPLGIGVQARHPEPDFILSIFHEQALASRSAASIFSSSKRFPISRSYCWRLMPSAPSPACPSSRSSPIRRRAPPTAMCGHSSPRRC